MSQPVKLSDALVLDARLAGKALERSIAGQVEFWARLGRAVEPLLQGAQALALVPQCRRPPAFSLPRPRWILPQGRRRVAGFLRTQPFPHYEPAPDAPGLLVRIEAGGKRTLGRFVNRQFQAAKTKPAKR